MTNAGRGSGRKRLFSTGLLLSIIFLVFASTLSPTFSGTALLTKPGQTESHTGQVCAIGDAGWNSEAILQELDAFSEVFTRQRQLFGGFFSSRNSGGNGLFHSFGIWFILTQLNPKLIVESGVHMGQTSWLMRQACPDAKIVRIDPTARGWEDSEVDATLSYNKRGATFTDFNSIKWADLFSREERANGVILFDDHIDHLVRMQQAQAHGFGHLIYDDNYMPGTGDCFSVKDACDGGIDGAGKAHSTTTPQKVVCDVAAPHFLSSFSPFPPGGTRGQTRRILGPTPPMRCTNFHRSCKPLSEAEVRTHAHTQIQTCSRSTTN